MTVLRGLHLSGAISGKVEKVAVCENLKKGVMANYKTHPKVLLNIFGIKGGALCRTENYKRWIEEVALLSMYERDEIEKQFELIIEQAGEKNPFYYIAAVRKSLEIKKHESMKKEDVSPTMRSILKGMAL